MSKLWHQIDGFIFSHLQTPFENIVAIGEIAHEKEFSRFPTIFSTQFNNFIFVYRKLPYICFHDFIVICCRFVVSGKKVTPNIEMALIIYLIVYCKSSALKTSNKSKTGMVYIVHDTDTVLRERQ